MNAIGPANSLSPISDALTVYWRAVSHSFVRYVGVSADSRNSVWLMILNGVV